MDTKLNQTNFQGQRHGLWESYYPNGQLRYKGNYQNGKLYGLCEIYYDNGKLWSKGYFKNYKEIGLWKENL